MSMPKSVATTLRSLYLDDETAWLELTARLVERRQFDDLDCDNLREFLLDMARRDRREVLSRLTILLAHLLKWDHEPDKRSGSWRATIKHQRDELNDLLESATLRRHAETVMAQAYARAVELAAIETQKSTSVFPSECPWTLDEALADSGA